MKIKVADITPYIWGAANKGFPLLQTNNFQIIEEEMEPNTREQLHFHHQAQQFFYVLDGCGQFFLEGKMYELLPGEGIAVASHQLHYIENTHPTTLRFLVISSSPASACRVNIIPFSTDHREAVKLLNTEWLEKYFYLEPGDVFALSNPETVIIDKGGKIFYAEYQGTIVGTASLLRIDDTVYELGKMAVTQSAQGLGIGKALLKHCIFEAQSKKIAAIILYSNTILERAITMYRQFGFEEIQLESGLYERANIKMKLML